ncbi:MAG: response regulator, partial [Nitrospinae bacterium]|nr:response regulator [Nitrospinota bacterium]
MARARILIAEDEREAAEVFAEFLTMEGYEVNTAADGEAATHMISENSYDLVLIDLVLPKA